MTPEQINKTIIEAYNTMPHPKFANRTISQDVLRRETGISNMTLSNFNKTLNIELKSLYKLCEFLGYEISLVKKN